MKARRIITLCGSRKFLKEFIEAEIYFTEQGFAVLSPIFYDEREITNELAIDLGKIHIKKIEIADKIVIIDVDQYIGESTKKELAYAKQQNKQISYYSHIFRSL